MNELAAHEDRRRVMGSDAHLVVVGGDASLLDRAWRRIDELEQRWSRFVATSEVCELNRRAGSAVAVSADTALLVQRAIDAHRLTGGLYDPTVLGDVVRAGYDRSFDELGAGSSLPAGTSALHRGVEGIVVGELSAKLPDGVGFDPGGIGKGLAADLVTAELLAAGAAGVCVNLGGDLRVSGSGPDGEPWLVAIEHEWTPEPVTVVSLGDGAVATSTTLRRHWLVDGAPRHHLIDPRTGQPATSDLTMAAVVAGEAWFAEVLTKALLVQGAPDGLAFVDALGADALAVTIDGAVVSSDHFVRFVPDAELPERIVRTR